MSGPGPAAATCSHCGYRADPDEAECPLCGSPLEREEPTAPKAEEGYRGAAWDLEGGRFPDDFIRAWKESVLSPSRFFSALRPGAALWRAILYYLVLTVVGSGLSLVWNAWTGGMAGAGAADLYEVLGLAPGQVQLLGFLAAPFMALAGWAFFSLVYHLLVALLVEERRGLRETARVLSYSWAGPQVFLVVPFVGGIVAGAWSLVLTVVGIREHHGTSTLRAVAVVLVPVLLFVLVPFVVAILALVGILGGGAGLPGT